MFKAAAPSCGGVSDRQSTSALYRATISDDQSLKRIACPIIFLSPANDFHGHIDDLQKAVAEIASKDWRVTCSAHHNHQDTEQYQVAGPLWFDQYLKGTFHYPQTPNTSLELKTGSSVPRFSIAPDPSRPVLSVDIFYTQQGQAPDAKHAMENTIARFWRHAEAEGDGKTWTADVPLLSTDKPLWIYANVLYPLDTPVVGAGYYYGVYTAKTVNISSTMTIVTPGQLTAAGVKAAIKPSPVIESFGKGWQKEWFTYDLSGNWARNTHKVYDPQYKAPAGAKLSIEVRAEQANQLVIGLGGYAAEVAVRGRNHWQTVILSADDFRNVDETKLAGWEGIKELRLGPSERLQPKQGGKPEGGSAHKAPAPGRRVERRPAGVPESEVDGRGQDRSKQRATTIDTTAQLRGVTSHENQVRPASDIRGFGPHGLVAPGGRGQSRLQKRQVRDLRTSCLGRNSLCADEEPGSQRAKVDRRGGRLVRHQTLRERPASIPA